MALTTQKIDIPRPIAQNFASPARFHVLKGGRGSGKTRAAAIWAAIRAKHHAEHGRSGVILAGREHLNSLEESSLEEIKQAIQGLPWLTQDFDIGEKYIRTADRRVSFAFAGLRHNLDSLKSKARILDAWIEEAENVSETAWLKLIPTIREEGSQLAITYNPESPDSATHRRFAASPDPDICVTHINYDANPWFPDVLEAERLRDQRNRPDTYDHVWLGAFLTMTDAQVFANKFEVADFEPQSVWDGPYFGLDFGFAQDPTAAVECYIYNNCLYIRREAGKVGLELDDTPAFITGRMPKISLHTVRADSARPESISYLQRHGIPSIASVKKWPGSIEDGVAFIKSLDRAIIHPDCQETAREFRLYAYKTDRLSGDIMPKIVDANNHYIDALRYALQPMIGGASGTIFGVL